MKTSNIIIAHPIGEDKFESLKAFMKSLNIRFEIAKEEDDITFTSSQKSILDERRRYAQKEDFISVDEASQRLKDKYDL